MVMETWMNTGMKIEGWSSRCRLWLQEKNRSSM